ncbi:MAG: hypothetical protein ACLVAW_07115 [Eisenbergiella massiliensis]
MACDNWKAETSFFQRRYGRTEKGCRENDKEMKCLICGETYEEGEIFPF